MRIIFIIDVWYPYYGGGVRHVEEIAQLLVNIYGHDVTVLTRSLRSNKNSVPPAIARPAFQLIKLGPKTDFNSWFYRLFFIVKAIYYALRNGSYDIIHGQANLGGVPARIVGWLTRKPVVYTVHGSGVNAWGKMAPGLKGRLMSKIELFLQCKIPYDAEISVDSDFFKIPGNINKRRYVIPNGVDTNFFRPDPSVSHVLHRLLFVGRLHPQKGLPILLKAFASLPWKDKTLRIVGDGQEKPSLEKLCVDLGIAKQVIFKGPLFGQELLKEYHEAEIFVLSSYYEGQPLTILEALATGLPVIATAVGANTTILKENRIGFLVPPNNINAFSEAIINFYRLSDRFEYGKQGRKIVEVNYQWSSVVDKFNHIYHELIKN